MSNSPKWIVWHTAADGDVSKGTDNDTTVATINLWHKANGWKGIGYHYVIRKNGDVVKGRADYENGAHAQGINSRSIGICFSGHADIKPHTKEQRTAGVTLTKELMAKYGISPQNVIGHREVNLLVASGILSSIYRVNKTCPGTTVDMDEVRRQLTGETGSVAKAATPLIVYRKTRPTYSVEIQAVQTLQELLARYGFYKGTIDGWAYNETSSGMLLLTGRYLLGDPRNKEMTTP